MAIIRDLKVCATLSSYPNIRTILTFPPSKRFTKKVGSQTIESIHFCSLNSIYWQVDFSGFPVGGSSTSLCNIKGKWPCMEPNSNSICCNSKRLGITGDFKISADAVSEETENFLLNAINMSFFERLSLAWKIIFPTPAYKRSSNANIAKQRLRMILFSDRCAVSDEAKEKIVSNIVNVLSDFVVIESQDKVQLNVSTDADLGTVYSVTVPVRRVKSEYQVDGESGSIMNVDYKDVGETSGNAVDVRFDFYVPEKLSDYGM